MLYFTTWTIITVKKNTEFAPINFIVMSINFLSHIFRFSDNIEEDFWKHSGKRRKCW